MDQATFHCLSQCLSDDANARMAGELQLKDLAKHAEYPSILGHIALGQTFPVGVRQLAAVTLKNYIDTHWSSKGEKFVGPEPSEQVKSVVRAGLLAGLADPLNKIRVVVASVISKIAHTDWPETWPNLFDALMVHVKSGNVDQLRGALRVMTEFVRDDITDQQFPHVVPVILPELFRIFSADNMYQPRIRAKAAYVFKQFMDILYMVTEEHPEAAQTYLAPVLPMWMEAFQKVLANSNTSETEIALKLETTRTLNKLIETFPKQMKPYMVHFLELIWNHVTVLKDRYMREAVTASDDADTFGEDVDSDGEVLDFQSQLYSMFEFIQLVAEKKTTRSLFTTATKKKGQSDSGPAQFLNELIYTMLAYLQITEDQAESWANDVNRFVQDDEDETFSFTIRISIQELLTTLVETFELEALQALTTAVQRHFDESSKVARAGGLGWWKIHEACFLAMGRVKEELTSAARRKTLKVDMVALLEHVVSEDLKRNDLPYLQGRALWFASQMTAILPGPLLSQYLATAVDALRHSPSGPVKISAIKAILSFCEDAPDSVVIQQHQAAIFEGIANIIGVAGEDTLALAIEGLQAAIKINRETTANYEAVIGPLVFNLWAQHPNDMVICSGVLDLVEDLASNPTTARKLQDRFLPGLLDAMRSETSEQNPHWRASAIQLMTSLVRTAEPPISPFYSQQIFPELMRLLLVSDDHAILQNGQEILKYLVQKDMHAVASWSDGTVTGMELIIQFIAKLLQPTGSESAGLYLGDLITKLIQKAGAQLVPVLPDLLTAVARRLESAQMPSFAQSLVLVFAQLVQTQRDTVVDFLSGLDINGKTGLSILIHAWCKNFGDFQGYYSLKVNAAAMSKLFSSPDPRLQAVVVDGELIEENATKIRTRSQAKRAPDQYQQIPFPAKAVKLLLAELQQNLESQMGKPSALTAAFHGIGGMVGDDDATDTADGSDDEDDDTGEWEDIEEASPFGDDKFSLLSDLIKSGEVDMDEPEENDADLQEDPIYHMDIKDYLVKFFKQCAADNTNHFNEICSHYLDPTEQQRMQLILHV